MCYLGVPIRSPELLGELSDEGLWDDFGGL